MSLKKSESVELACFVTSFVLEGVQRCSGIFFSWTLDQWEESRQKAAIPFVVSRATAYIVSVVCKDFLRSEKLEISLQCGIFLGILGSALSFISGDVIWLTICWGIIFGGGIGISSPEPLKVSQKFRVQPILLLLCCAAPSIACIFLPYFLQFLLCSYGLCGCLLIVSGIALNAVPFIMVASYRIRFQLRKPLWRIRKKYEVNVIEKSGLNSTPVGADNECFEPENSSSTTTSTATATVVEIITAPNARQTILLHTNPDLLPVRENLDSATFDNPRLLSNAGDNVAFVRDMDDEDVLFELTSNGLMNQAVNSSNQIGENEFESEMPDSVENNKSFSYRNRRDTIIDSLQKPNANVFPKNSILNKFHTNAPNDLKESLSYPPKNVISFHRNNISDSPAKHINNRNGVVEAVNNHYPLEIKVHVVECTFTEDDVRDGRLLTQSVPRKGSYRRHSNSLISSQYNNVNFTSPHFSKVYNKPSSLYGNPSSNMYLISEDEELHIDASSPSNNPTTVQPRQRPICLRSLKKILKPTCLVVIYAFVIHEVTLVTLLTIFDDHIDGLVSPATGVLPAYGVGGILGRLSVKYWGDRLLLEGSHATAALLFILHGVVVAGILWSPNIYWIGGFYAIVGFLEIGISTAVWNLVYDHIEVKAKSTLFTTCKLLCGICALFVPYTIGLSRDVMGEYDGLLQITSGLSVLCAFLCYILPKFTFHAKHVRGS